MDVVLDSGWPCLSRRIKPAELRRSLPTSTILWFCGMRQFLTECPTTTACFSSLRQRHKNIRIVSIPTGETEKLIVVKTISCFSLFSWHPRRSLSSLVWIILEISTFNTFLFSIWLFYIGPNLVSVSKKLFSVWMHCFVWKGRCKVLFLGMILFSECVHSKSKDANPVPCFLCFSWRFLFHEEAIILARGEIINLISDVLR